MKSFPLEVLATAENFDEQAYLRANQDVARAIESGVLTSGRAHFDAFGTREGRRLQTPGPALAEAKARKLARLDPLLNPSMPRLVTPNGYDYLSEELRVRFNIIDTDAVSSNQYDHHVLQLIERCTDGLVLDCGAGLRPVYYENVVNFDIAAYETTDVRGVGEVLPFVDEAFDAVISIAVLEHVKDPFQCAREIARVLKPGGSLICCVPFLQPLHGYPHHYYNMTSQGVQNLFNERLTIDRAEVYQSVLPIWSLTWMLRSWAEGLQGRTREEFLARRVGDLVQTADHYLDEPFVTELSPEKNLELASATVIFAHKERAGRTAVG